MKKHFLLFSNCVITKGASRCIISDLQNGFYIFIPHFFADIIESLKELTIEEFCILNKEFSNKYIVEKIQALIDLDLGHYTTTKSAFPAINEKFETPYQIQDCIIELSEKNYVYRKKIMNELTVLGCQSLEMRAYDFFSLDKIGKTLENINTTRIRNVEIYIKHHASKTINYYLSFLEKYNIISRLVIHSCSNKTNLNFKHNRIFFTIKTISNSKCCGEISPELFTINLSAYLESLNFNSCLNKKISLDINGKIKNCPSMSEVYGDIESDSLIEIVLKSQFKKLWTVNKDTISVCKDCEFRYICSDCRAFISNKHDKPVNCNYDPYTMSYIKR